MPIGIMHCAINQLVQVFVITDQSCVFGHEKA